jgi:hypothetical protein
MDERACFQGKAAVRDRVYRAHSHALAAFPAPAWGYGFCFFFLKRVHMRYAANIYTCHTSGAFLLVNLDLYHFSPLFNKLIDFDSLINTYEFNKKGCI